MIVSKNITGWKWETLEAFNDSRAIGDLHFGFPKDGCVTTSCMNPKENRDSRGGLLFYYVGDNIQLREFLPDPTTFDINIEIPD